MRILFLSRWFPYPPDNGSKIRVFNILKQLSLSHDISLIAFTDRLERSDKEAFAALRNHCRNVRAVPYRAFQPSRLRSVAGLLSTQPRFLVDTFSDDMSAAVRHEVNRQECDVIVASQLDMAPYALRQEGVPAILEELELTAYRDAAHDPQRRLTRWRWSLTWFKLSRYTRRILPRFAICTVVSQQEWENARSVAPDYTRVEVVPNAIDLGLYDNDFGSPLRNTLVFTGALTYDANYDAACHYLTTIHSRIRREVPDLKVRITGNTNGVDLTSLPDGAGVEYTGYVQDIRPVIAQSWAAVVPLRSGGGTRLKILEAMAVGTPVVSTSKGAEGLDVTDGENILIADEPGEFADKVTQLLRSPELRQRLAWGGRELVAAKYNWDVCGAKLRKLIEEAVTTSPEGVVR